MTPQEAIREMMDAGATQGDIAILCNVTQPAISQILTGKNATPNYTLGTELVRLGKLAKRRKGKQNEKK
jgi:predicted transcriptional regulator